LSKKKRRAGTSSPTAPATCETKTNLIETKKKLGGKKRGKKCQRLHPTRAARGV